MSILLTEDEVNSLMYARGGSRVDDADDFHKAAQAIQLALLEKIRKEPDCYHGLSLYGHSYYIPTAQELENGNG